MTEFNPHHNGEMNLTLSQQELRNLHVSVGSALIRFGEISSNPNTRIPETLTEARHFTYALPTSLIKEIFYGSDSKVEVIPGACISYAPPHLIPDNEDESVYENIYLSHRERITGTDIESVSSLFILKKDEVYEGFTETEYTRDGLWVSPNDLTPVPREAVPSEEDFIAHAYDRGTFHEPLSIHDVENLRKVEAYILQARRRVA